MTEPLFRSRYKHRRLLKFDWNRRRRFVIIAAIFFFSIGLQKILLDWVDPSDVALGVGLVWADWLILSMVGWHPKRRFWILVITGLAYTGFDYLCGISGNPLHYWNYWNPL